MAKSPLCPRVFSCPVSFLGHSAPSPGTRHRPPRSLGGGFRHPFPSVPFYKERFVEPPEMKCVGSVTNLRASAKHSARPSCDVAEEQRGGAAAQTRPVPALLPGPPHPLSRRPRAGPWPRLQLPAPGVTGGSAAGPRPASRPVARPGRATPALPMPDPVTAARRLRPGRLRQSGRASGGASGSVCVRGPGGSRPHREEEKRGRRVHPGGRVGGPV